MSEYEVTFDGITGSVKVAAEYFEITRSGALVFWNRNCKVVAFNNWNGTKRIEKLEEGEGK